MSWETGANLFVVTSFCLHPATRRVFFFASLDLLFLKMASESEFSLSSTSSKSDEESEDSEQDMEVVYSRFEPLTNHLRTVIVRATMVKKRINMA